jgi:hypothetical protein
MGGQGLTLGGGMKPPVEKFSSACARLYTILYNLWRSALPAGARVQYFTS